MSEISEIEIKSMTKEQNYMRGYKDGKFDALDKIRAEVEQMDLDFGDFYENTDSIVEMVLQTYSILVLELQARK